MITRKLNKEKTMARNPEHLGTVAGIKFYEHPIYGDESPIIADTGTEFGVTDFWEVPTLDEIFG